MMSMPTWLSVAGPEITVGSMPNSSRSSFAPPQAPTGSLAQSTIAVMFVDDLLVAQDRLDAVGAEQAVAELEDNRVGFLSPRARSSSERVSAGAFFDVVAQMPKSENIAMWRAPESSMAKMSRRSATPVDLNASTTRPLWRKRLDDRARSGGLAGVHASARDGDDGHAMRVERHVELQRLGRDARRHADALAQVRKVEHAAQDLAVERLAVRRIDRVADADHAAEVQ